MDLVLWYRVNQGRRIQAQNVKSPITVAAKKMRSDERCIMKTMLKIYTLLDKTLSDKIVR